MGRPLRIAIRRQPDEQSCGPTCLHAIYSYFGDRISLARVIREVESLERGGTLEVLLACHALRRGYTATVYTFNLQVWDPSWFGDGVSMERKLRAQARQKKDWRLRVATRAYLEFLALGGRVVLSDLTPELISGYLERRVPILAGLSATFLYRSAREHRLTQVPDDVRGAPAGHFVVLCGYDARQRRVAVADPLASNPFKSQRYNVVIDRLIGAVLLGTLTYDAAMLVIEPGEGKR